MAAAAVIQRPFRGSRVSTFYPVKTLPPLSSLDSAFQLQEYISLLIRHNVHDVERIVALPGKPGSKEGDESSESAKNDDKEAEKARSDVTVDEACWIYEQLRRLAQDLTHPLITMLQQECSRSTCSEMKAGEWLYLCVAHGTDGAMEQCCAIDYILHTLDSATALLNSPRAFPSRLQIPAASHRHFSSLARRLGRIFAHAYFHHRDIFAQAEAESSLYARFLALTSLYDLVPADFIVIPSKVVTSDGEGDDGDIPRDALGKGQKVISDASDAQGPRLLAASIDPQGDREKDKFVQRPTSAPPMNTAFNPTSVRVISNRNNKTRNPPGLFVSGGGLMPVSATATAAPTTAASLFESTETPISTTASQTLPPPSTTTTATGATTLAAPLASGQESPRKIGRPRTDTMIYTEDASSSGESGRGTSPIPVVRLGARLNEPEHPPDVSTGKTEEPQRAVDAEHKTGVSAQLIEEPEPFVVPENLETGHAADTADAAIAAVEEEAKVEDADVSAADFEPIDYEMVVGGHSPLAEEPATVELSTNEKEEQDQTKTDEEPHHPATVTSESEEPAQVEELPTPAEEESQVENPESATATSGEITEAPNGEHPAEAAVSGEGSVIADPAPASSTPPEQVSVPEAEAEPNPPEVVQGESATASEEGEGGHPVADETAVVESSSLGEGKEEEVAGEEGSES
ncbi:hypothetical protein M378DRAFT_26752 [Amanita muscaria Koide BX008]|uniref:Mob1/phocein n=1 Tax=Amanita muscaria (strain Koide BX008) TaxID=946122 RepID=A0A0C2SAS5_AMAMK|nr:hypothetical protein M378DRAFT_26752 [Amanita muscaria Koide BX008]